MKHVFLALWILSGFLLPLTALVVLILLNSVAMGPLFIVPITIENRSAEEVRVTPVGAVGTKGHRSRLPTCLWQRPALPAFRDGDFRIPPGGTIKFHYDADDIQFSEIVVADSRGRVVQMAAVPDPYRNQYRAPETRHFVIDNLDSMTEPTLEVGRAVERKSRLWLFWTLMFIGMAALPMFVLLRRAYRTRTRSANPPASVRA